MRRYVSFLLMIPFLLCAQDIKTPAQIQKELNEAQAKYEKSKAMFNPWYTGPLITPPASMMPVGMGAVQPYVIISGTYASFNKDRESIAIPHNLYSLQVPVIVLCGVTDSVDFTLTPQAGAKWQNHHSGGGFNDLTAAVGFLITPQTLYVPAMKFILTETFPTGKYQNLSHNGLGLNGTGEGSFQTQFGFATSKIIWWAYPHPVHLRLFFGYTIASSVEVHNFNAYGGGIGTKGTVWGGNSISADFGAEVSLSQGWVLACDVVYQAVNAIHFHGIAGVLPGSGAPAAVGSGYSDNLSLAPALEYNWNENLGIVTGIQFSVYGRNSGNFVNGQFSVTYTW